MATCSLCGGGGLRATGTRRWYTRATETYVRKDRAVDVPWLVASSETTPESGRRASDVGCTETIAGNVRASIRARRWRYVDSVVVRASWDSDVW